MKSRIWIMFIIILMTKDCHGGILFSSLPRTLLITASASHEQVLNAGEDKIKVRWELNKSYENEDGSYKKVKVVLCFAPVSQIDRGWRQTKDDLSKDNTCPFTVVEKDYDSVMSQEWKISDAVPTGTYFVRVYAYDSTGQVVGFGQSTDSSKTNNLFLINGFHGSHLSFQIASACFSAFSIASLFCYLLFHKTHNSSIPN